MVRRSRVAVISGSSSVGEGFSYESYVATSSEPRVNGLGWSGTGGGGVISGGGDGESVKPPKWASSKRGPFARSSRGSSSSCRSILNDPKKRASCFPHLPGFNAAETNSRNGEAEDMRGKKPPSGRRKSEVPLASLSSRQSLPVLTEVCVADTPLQLSSPLPRAAGSDLSSKTDMGEESFSSNSSNTSRRGSVRLSRKSTKRDRTLLSNHCIQDTAPAVEVAPVVLCAGTPPPGPVEHRPGEHSPEEHSPPSYSELELSRAVGVQTIISIPLLCAIKQEGQAESLEYPYLREMRDRLLSEDSPSGAAGETRQDTRLLRSGSGAVGTVVKLEADGYTTCPTQRMYTPHCHSRQTPLHSQPPLLGAYAKNAKTSSFITLSMLYATLLVVICLGFLLSEVLTHNVPLYYYEAFFTYLYALSILFLLYVFLYLLTAGSHKPKKAQVVFTEEADKSKGEEAGEVDKPSLPRPRKAKISDNEHSHGSFFLRIGAITFGLGTMIYNGLEFMVFWEIPFESPCHMLLRGVNPVLQMIFTFMQMYFIFMNARLNVHKFKFVARFGMMHMVATNVCVWVRTLVRESLKEINEVKASEGLPGEHFMIIEGIRRAMHRDGLLAPNKYMYNLDEFVEGSGSVNGTFIDAQQQVREDIMVNASCGRVEIMGTIVDDSAPYLYPFIVEYSLIGACVLFIMWKHIGRSPKYVYDPELGDGVSVASRRCQVKVDCIGASKGLFLGLLVLVGTLICLILFFVLFSHPVLRRVAVYLADVSHCAIMLLSILACFVGFCRVRQLRFHGEREEELDDILLMVSAFGLFAYATFSAVAGSLSAYREEPNILVLVTSCLSIVQVVVQMVFIKDCQRRQVVLPEHERTKPGRQVVTFLLICNLAMWVVYTFETQKVETNPVQLEFFGKLAWTILLRCTIPLAIFHRFHSSVVLAAIWKNSYKSRIE